MSECMSKSANEQVTKSVNEKVNESMNLPLAFLPSSRHCKLPKDRRHVLPGPCHIPLWPQGLAYKTLLNNYLLTE